MKLDCGSVYPLSFSYSLSEYLITYEHDGLRRCSALDSFLRLLLQIIGIAKKGSLITLDLNLFVGAKSTNTPHSKQHFV